MLRGRNSLIVAAIAALLIALPAASSHAAVCGTPVAYPGDAAAPEAIANWMANGAVALNIPGELPVMAALVESGMKNLNYGDADSVGYFQMRTGIWNSGSYAGYPTNADLQLKWFTDQAAKVRLQRTTSGLPDPAALAEAYGEWIADVERPAAQYRSRYQLQLANARTLIAATCPDLQTGDLTPPRFSAKIPSRQHPLRSKAISLRLICPAEACNATPSATIGFSGASSVVRVDSETTMLGPGVHKSVKLQIGPRLRKRIKRALASGGTVRARLRLRVADRNGVAAFKIAELRLLP